MKNFLNKILILVIFSIFLTEVRVVFGEMSSSNYKIKADVIGVSGGTADSSTYRIKDTLGEPVIGITSGVSNIDKQGFWQMVSTRISIQLDSATKNLGTITPGIPVSGETTINVITDAWGGYELYVFKDALLTHTDTSTTISDYSCSITSPCSWSGTGLGFTIKSGTSVDSKWGSGLNYASIPNSSTKFHQVDSYFSGADETIVEYKVDVPSTQKSGDYSNIISFVAVERL